jgi:hypothetical protein
MPTDSQVSAFAAGGALPCRNFSSSTQWRGTSGEDVHAEADDCLWQTPYLAAG